jgi:phenylacetate-CoA ligase
MPWNKEFECMPVEKLQKFQLEKLQETVSWVAKKVPFYKKKFKELGIKPADITSLEDAAKLPVTVKEDLRDNYPFDLCAVPLKEVVRVHASSGTTGKPITGPYTQDDLDQWTECMARNFGRPVYGRKTLSKTPMGTAFSPAGSAFTRAPPRWAAPWCPPAPVMTERQITLMQDFKIDVLCCTPSYALTIAERAEEMGRYPSTAAAGRHFRSRTLDSRHARPRSKSAWASRPWRPSA